MIRSTVLEKLACQQCLSPLSAQGSSLVCQKCGMSFPVHRGLVFMGYDKSRSSEMEQIISTERDHQTSLGRIEQQYGFAAASFRLAHASISVLASDVRTQGAVAVDIGSGGAPMSKLLAEQGFDTYRCELDPNSLYSGFIWEHPNLEMGKHIVCDSGILPFRDGSVDVVFCKELIHHVVEYPTIFREINRVLKIGGVFLMIEPAVALLQSFGEDDHCGHHFQTIFAYHSALEAAGFRPFRHHLYYYKRSRRLKVLNVLKERLSSQVYSDARMSPSVIAIRMCIQRVVGGSNTVFLTKLRACTELEPRPSIQIVQPSQLILEDSYLTDERVLKFREILREIVGARE